MACRFAAFVLAWLALAALVACQRAAPVAPAPAASAAAAVPASAPARGAADDTPDALMQEAFPDWGGQKAFVTTILSGDPKDPSMMVAIEPAFVVAVDDTHRVLVTRDTLSDEAGHLGGGHPMPVAVGAYWFTARSGRWFVSRRDDAVLIDGASGNVGKVAPLELGAGHHAISVENGDCHQGACNDFLDVVELVPGKPGAQILRDTLSSRNGGFNGACEDVLKGASAPSVAEPGDDCVDITGKWRLEANADAPRPDIVVHFTGREMVRDDATHAVTVKTVDETEVYRYRDGKYALASGRNPTHGF